MISVNVQQVARTRLCAADLCPEDAEHGRLLCKRCNARRAAGGEITLQAPERKGETLRCSSCEQELPASEFGVRTLKKNGDGKAYAMRRGRRHDCKACEKYRRRQRWLELGK